MADDGWRLGHRRGLDQLRGVAVLLVVVSHGTGGAVIGMAGGVGVSLFFVLSGFLITRLLIEERRRTDRIDLRAFYLRRARRLLPALPLFCAVAAVANALAGVDVVRPLVATATYTTNYASTGDFGAFGHLWSLAVEEHFYFFWPVLMAILPLRAGLPLATGGAVASIALRLSSAPGELEAYQWTQYRVDAILVGAALAFVIAWIRTPHPTTVGVAVLVAGVFCLNVTRSTFLGLGMTAVALAGVVLVVGCLGDVTPLPWLERVGRLSYGLYLFHWPVRVVLDGYALSTPVKLALTAGIGWMLAELSWRVVEIRWSRRTPQLRPPVERLGGRALHGAGAGG